MSAMAAMLAAVLAMRPASQAQGSRPSVALLLMFGLKAAAPERWDGSVALSAGRIVRLSGRHFSDGDAVSGESAWKCQTRRDTVAPYADIHYTEMRPGSTPEVRFQPVGVYLALDAPAAARLSVQTAQGDFDVSLTQISNEPTMYLEGRASAQIVPTTELLSGDEYEDDEPSIAALPHGDLAVAWVAYRNREDRVLLRTRRQNVWTAAEEVTLKPGDIFRTSLAAAGDGSLWVFWSERSEDEWSLWGRRRQGGAWQQPEKISGADSATFHQAAASANGEVYAVWQGFLNGQSDIFLRGYRSGRWSEIARLSESPANDWEPSVAPGAGGTAYVAWDSYDAGNYDIHFRSWRGGSPGELEKITASPRFQAHAGVAVDDSGRPWLAWNESGVNWAKDQGFLLPVPLASPIHQVRSLRVAMKDGGRWISPTPSVAESLPPAMRENAEHPKLVFTRGGALGMVFRHWTRRQSRSIGSPMVWENYLTWYDGRRWTSPQPMPDSGSWVEKHAGLARDASGVIWAAWMTDNRPFATMIPANCDVLAAALPPSPGAALNASSFEPFRETFDEEIPVHPKESEDVRAIRAYTINSAGKQYKIRRGDMHRHTDISQDFKYDGSLIEVYRYGLDAAGFDYIAPTDHQAGYDQEYSWWQSQKLVDLFLVKNRFVPLFAYERSLRYPNGHRNIVWARRGVRTLPIPAEEAAGREGAKKLFEHLRQTGGISMPHSSATDQGTDWRDNDPEVEPLMEIFQGYRNSYEYEGAPRAASTLNQHVQKSGWQPSGFWWNALDKGYKLGVQASSDHWSTHISYACLLADSFTREGLMDAIRKRHSYAATDNIILDFRVRTGGAEAIMGDILDSPREPRFIVTAVGTGVIKQVDMIKNKRFVYTSRPASRNVSFEYSDPDLAPGESWYYIRVLQEDGQLAWSSPIWLRR